MRKHLLSALTGSALLTAPQVALADKSDNSLTVAFEEELQNMDSYFNIDRMGIIVARHIWDSLLYRDPADFSYKPALATSYEWIDDTTMEFKLREGVQFHNGEPFDADDVVYTFNFISDPGNGVLNQRNVSWIAGAEKIDQFTVRLKLKAPFPAALDFLSGPLPIYPNEYYAEVGPAGMNDKPIGTGPYKLISATPGKEMIFEANEAYYPESPKGQPSIKHLTIRTITDRNTTMAELMAGGIDWMWQVSPDQAGLLKSSPMLSVIGGETMRIGYLQFDAAGLSGDSPVTNVLVRRAIMHAINRQAIVDNLLPEGSQVVHAACFPTQFGCTDDVVKYDYDPAKAKALLAEAGYPDGFSITLNAYRDRNMAEAMMGDLAKVGISATLNYNNYPPIRDIIRGHKSQLNFLTWGSYSVNDVSGSTSVFFKNSADDLARDEEVNAWLEEGDTTVDSEKRLAAYGKALKKIADQEYWTGLWSYSYYYAFAADLDFTPTRDEIPRFFTSSWK